MQESIQFENKKKKKKMPWHFFSSPPRLYMCVRVCVFVCITIVFKSSYIFCKDDGNNFLKVNSIKIHSVSLSENMVLPLASHRVLAR